MQRNPISMDACVPLLLSLLLLFVDDIIMIVCYASVQFRAIVLFISPPQSEIYNRRIDEHN